jgi:cardiolipin synthase
VAVVDGRWLTVGSSNLDPLSLLLAREANIVARDPSVAADLRQALLTAIEEGSRRVDGDTYARRSWAQCLIDRGAYALMRLAIFVAGRRY